MGAPGASVNTGNPVTGSVTIFPLLLRLRLELKTNVSAFDFGLEQVARL